MVKEKKITTLAYQGEIFNVEFYVTLSGQSPSRDFIDSLSVKQQQRLFALLTMIADHGKLMNEQKFKHLTGSDSIFEFKANQNRVFCFFYFAKRIILTNGFIKKSPKTPKKEISKAEALKAEFEQRSKK